MATRELRCKNDRFLLRHTIARERNTHCVHIERNYDSTRVALSTLGFRQRRRVSGTSSCNSQLSNFAMKPLMSKSVSHERRFLTSFRRSIKHDEYLQFWKLSLEIDKSLEGLPASETKRSLIQLRLNSPKLSSLMRS